MEASFKEITSVIKNKPHLYSLLSSEYYLPDPSSKAITKEYLIKYSEKPIPIFVMKNTNVIHYCYTYRNYSSAELLELWKIN